MDSFLEFKESYVDYCEICGDKADTTCQNCGQLVCGGCFMWRKWGVDNEEMIVCDCCAGVLDDYAEMNADHFSEEGVIP